MLWYTFGRNHINVVNVSVTKLSKRIVIIKRHFRIHAGNKPYQCSQCNKHFSNISNLKRYVRMHTGEKPYQCSHCDLVFSHNTKIETHEAEKSYKFSHCEKALFSKRRSDNIYQDTYWWKVVSVQTLWHGFLKE